MRGDRDIERLAATAWCLQEREGPLLVVLVAGLGSGLLPAACFGSVHREGVDAGGIAGATHPPNGRNSTSLTEHSVYRGVCRCAQVGPSWCAKGPRIVRNLKTRTRLRGAIGRTTNSSITLHYIHSKATGFNAFYM